MSTTFRPSKFLQWVSACQMRQGSNCPLRYGKVSGFARRVILGPECSEKGRLLALQLIVWMIVRRIWARHSSKFGHRLKIRKREYTFEKDG